MTMQMVVDLTFKSLTTSLIAAAPMMGTAIIVGIVINVIQSVTQIRDASLSFVPKAVAAAVVLVICLPWGLGVLVDFCMQMFVMMGDVGG